MTTSGGTKARLALEQVLDVVAWGKAFDVISGDVSQLVGASCGYSK